MIQAQPLIRLVLVLITLCNLSAASETTPPNLVLILADDLGIGNVGCYGSDNYQTPQIDRLASTGIRFTRMFTAALCGPSRALIMSGRYAFRNGSTNQDACLRMNPAELVLPKLLKSAGYHTAMIGKYGQLPGRPEQIGFDDSLVFNGSGVYWNPTGERAQRYRVNGEERELSEKDYMPDLMHDRALGFIRKNREQPFFLLYSMVHVHGEIQPTPDSQPESDDLFGDNIRYMDKLVGNLLDELDTLKLRDKTLVIFMGDNGTGKGQYSTSTVHGRSLSGMKGSMLECGGLVPLIASWPGQTPTGKVSADLLDSTDIVATFSALAGTILPANIQFDGRSFAPQLRGEPGRPRDWVFNQLARMWYVRDAQWKLNERGELYNMSDAPFTETLIAAGSEDTTAASARARLASVLQTLNPAGGILDTGDGTGRHSGKDRKKQSGGSKGKNAE